MRQTFLVFDKDFVYYSEDFCAIIVQVESGVLPDERMLSKLHKQVNIRLLAHRSNTLAVVQPAG